MLTLDILIKSIVLLYRDSVLNKDNETKDISSKLVVKKLLDTDKKYNKRKKIGGESDFVDELMTYIYSLLDLKGELNQVTILESFNLIASEYGKDGKCKTLDKLLNTELTDELLVKSVLSLKEDIRNFQKEMELKWLFKIANIELNNKSSGDEIKNYVLDVIEKIKPLTETEQEKDPALLSEIDVTKPDSMTSAIERMQDSRSSSVLMTGFKGLNKMLQGGFRRHELWLISALQHNYKSGLLQTLFVQLCMLNKPHMIDPNKKPAIIYLSFEDDPHIFLEHMYKYCYYSEFRKNPDMNNVNPKEMGEYLKSKLVRNGYTPIMLKVDPTSWTLDKLLSKMKLYMSEGYEIHACIIDYLTKLPTTGCDRSGPAGTDVRDMFQQVRSFFSKNQIACITAHQLSTDAVMLKRQNFTGEVFLKELIGKGYTELSKQIPHILDGELYICLDNKGNDETYLCFQRGKHRIPTRISDKDMFFKIRFPDHQAPIPEDISEPDDTGTGLDKELSILGF